MFVFFSPPSLTVTKHNREVDVVAGDVRIVILLHESHGKPFLWPVLKERPNNNENLEGILGEEDKSLMSYSFVLLLNRKNLKCWYEVTNTRPTATSYKRYEKMLFCFKCIYI